MKKNQIIFLLLITLFISCDLKKVVSEDDNKKIEDNQSLIYAQRGLTDSEKKTHVNQLLKDGFKAWQQAVHVDGFSFNPAVISDVNSLSWGNYGMRDLNEEPRKELSNDGSWGYQSTFDGVVWDFYSVISSMSEARRHLLYDGLLLDGANSNTRALAYSSFILGLTYGSMATIYDKAIYFDESSDFNNELEMKTYDELNSIAINFLKTSISIIDTAAAFHIPKDWLPKDYALSDSTSSTLLKSYMHSYIARFSSQVARKNSEANKLDWQIISDHASKGAPFHYIGDGEFLWSRTQYYTGVSRSWGRVDYKTIGPADTTDGYTNWLGDGSDAAVQARTVFNIGTIDKRITAGQNSSDDSQLAGSYMLNEYRTRLVASRGTYSQSHYWWTKTSKYGNDLNDSIVDLPMSELDLIQAESSLRQENAGLAAFYINKSRTAKGGLPSLASSTSLGSYTDPPNGKKDATLWAAYKYEAILENALLNPYSTLALRRRWDDLVKGSLTMFPLPYDFIEFLILDSYTFGGQSNAGQPGTAGRKTKRIGEPLIPYRFEKLNRADTPE
tara:strand:- start:131 stop:1801 length:1671 start_codon:yes stop_codon:yes gene_type:complete